VAVVAEQFHREKRTTLTDIAEQVGVTVATVSNAFNRPEKLSADLRSKILRVAGELGFTGPSAVARNLRRGSAGAIGWIVHESLTYITNDPAMLPFLQGMAAELQSARLGFLFIPSSQEEAPDVSVIERAIVDGFIVTFGNDNPMFDAVRSTNIPFVIVEEPRIEGVRSVLVDGYSGARSAAEHLLELGHRDFGILLLRTGHDGYIGPVTQERLGNIGHEITRERITGYLDALVAADIDIESVVMYEPLSTPAGGYEGMQWVLSQKKRPTALLAMSDNLAFGAMDAAAKAGLSIPKDLSIVGFDGTAQAAHSSPPLTTVAQPLYEKGRRAVGLLLHPEQFDDIAVNLATELVVRASTSPPSK
jgi:DNA-binding LacI/PurR family transcriptional regulator